MTHTFRERLESNMAPLTSCLYQLYGSRWDFYRILDRLTTALEKASLAHVPSPLASQKEWYLDGKQAGYVLYVDLFAGNFKGLLQKIPYLKKLGITYVHLMPLFRCPQKENDGGYAVSSYRETDERLGTLNELKKVAAAFHEAGMRVVVDFVFNHTSDEHEWALKAKEGDEFYKAFYFIYPNKADADEWNNTLREIFPEVG